jgi:hypothetical protein
MNLAIGHRAHLAQTLREQKIGSGRLSAAASTTITGRPELVSRRTSASIDPLEPELSIGLDVTRGSRPAAGG